MKKISVIIPCYNAVNYLDRSVSCLVNQTIGIDNLELIFVNDASTDNTYEVLCSWEEKYPDSIMVINCEENKKQGAARNIGLSYSSGEYIGFMDDDDMIEIDMFAKLYGKAVKYGCDMVVCGAKRYDINEEKNISMERFEEEDILFDLSKPERKAEFLDHDINRAIWNKIYSRKLIQDNNLYFPEGYIYDDICFSELVKHYASKVYYLKEYLYHHLVHDNAASLSSKNWIDRLGYFDVNVILLQELKDRGIFCHYKERYENNFIIEYIATIKGLIKTYGLIPAKILNDMNSMFKYSLPDYRSNSLFMKMLEGRAGTFYEMISAGLNCDIDDNYILNLAKALQV